MFELRPRKHPRFEEHLGPPKILLAQVGRWGGPCLAVFLFCFSLVCLFFLFISGDRLLSSERAQTQTQHSKGEPTSTFHTCPHSSRSSTVTRCSSAQPSSSPTLDRGSTSPKR